MSLQNLALTATGFLTSGVAYYYRYHIAYWISLTHIYYQIKGSSQLHWYDRIQFDTAKLTSVDSIDPNSTPNPSQTLIGKIYIGALPLKKPECMIDQLVNKLQISSVITIVNDYELDPPPFSELTPVTPDDWKEVGVEQTIINAPDFLPLEETAITKGVETLHRALLCGHNVYLHCKAGRGRSVTILVVYLVLHCKYSLEEAYCLVKKQRTHVNMNSRQFQAARKYLVLKSDTL